MHVATQLAIVSGIIIIVVLLLIFVFNPGFQEIIITPGEVIIRNPPSVPETYVPPDDNNNEIPIVEIPEEKIPPNANIFGPSSAKRNTEISFTAEFSSDPDGGEIIKYLWKTDDGSTYHKSSISHVFINAGTHVIYLEVTDDEEQTGQLHYFINISP